jgi:hypothetical protein
MKKVIKIILPVIMFCLVAEPVLALQPIVDTASGKYDEGNYELIDFIVLLINISDWILAISGSAALLAFIVGGLLFLTSGGSPDRVTAGKGWLKGAIIGLLIVFTSYMIIDFVITGIFGIERGDRLGSWYQVK